jgi:hypothetical protein
MNTPEKKHYSPTTEDRARLKRLAEEIDGRTAELASILVRQIEGSPQWPLVEYKLRIRPATAGMKVIMHEVTFTDGSKFCNDGEQKITCSGPCPC